MPLVAVGGLVLGGQAVSSFVGPGPCGCVGGVPQPTYTVTVSAGTGDYAVFNGMWIVPFFSVPACFGQLVLPGPPPFFVGIGVNFSGQAINLQTLAAPFAIARYSHDPPWNCQSPLTGWQLTSFSGSGSPPVVSLAP